jgi:hydrogenase-4 component B
MMGMLFALVIALGLLAVPLSAPTRSTFWAPIAVTAMLVIAAGMAVAALVHPTTLLAAGLPFGVLRFTLSAWSAAWLLLAVLLLALAALAMRGFAAPSGTYAALAWAVVGVAGVLCSQSVLALVASWGVMALAAYALIMVGARHPRTLDAAWIMMVINEAGAALLLLGAVLWLAHIPGAAVPAALLGIVGMGAKAGLFPFQLWLPVAEPEAPGSVAGVLSGVLTMVSLLGIWRWVSWVNPPGLVVPWTLIALGAAGALLGTIHALLDEDYKRVLAYSTAEWMGLAFLGLGLAILFKQDGLSVAGSLAEDGVVALLIMHAAAKPALFAASEWIETATGTRNMNHLGGLMGPGRPLMTVLIAATVALMGFPPTAGFLAEWMPSESLFMAPAALRVVLGLVVLSVALVTAGGATAMLRWYGMLALGPQRASPSAGAPTGLVVMAAVSGAVAWSAGIGVGWWSAWVPRAAPALAGERSVAVMAPTFMAQVPTAAAGLVPLGARLFSFLPGIQGLVIFPGGFTVSSPWDLTVFGGLFLTALLWLRRRAWPATRRVGVWAGGVPYAPRHAWTPAAVTHPLRLAFAPVISLKRTRTVEGREVRVSVDTVDRLLQQGFHPSVSLARRLARLLSRWQDGQLGHYVVYMLGVLVGLIVVGKLVGWF